MLARTYQCGDVRVEAAVAPDRSLRLVLPQADVRLLPEAAASGARYRGAGVEFWTRGAHEAMLTEAGQPPQACMATTARSPWALAREQGARFRAIGHEPAWSVEVHAGALASLRVALSYRSQVLDLEGVEPLADGRGYRGGVGGPAVFLRIEPSPCTDAATGTVFPAVAILQVDGRTLRGCGRRLDG